tara:strand:+ start:47 stop:607 length:561 start_codon:yes stop_codon:yes gene_type:complete
MSGFSQYSTQNQLLLNKLLNFYKKNNNLSKILSIINGESKISLRLIDWFTTNYAKKNFIVYQVVNNDKKKRFKVYVDYKLKLKAYSKRRFDPFCRWERINIPFDDDSFIQTTIGQLNFFKWALENKIIEFIRDNYEKIEADMNKRNSTARHKVPEKNKTRKKRQELSVSATKSIKKEQVEIVVKFN